MALQGSRSGWPVWCQDSQPSSSLLPTVTWVVGRAGHLVLPLLAEVDTPPPGAGGKWCLASSGSQPDADNPVPVHGFEIAT